MALEPYSPQRLVLMTILAAILAPLAYVVGFPEACIGIVVGTPISIINYRSSYMALQAANKLPGPRSLMLLWKKSMLRLGLDMAALTAAAFLGAEFLLGVLIGILLELFSYYIDVVRLVVAWHRGDSGWQKKSKN